MIIGVPKETLNGENRIGVTPNTIKELIKHSFEVIIESGAGKGSFINDNDYQSVGAKIEPNINEIYNSSDIIIKVNPPNSDEINLLKEGCSILSFKYLLPIGVTHLLISVSTLECFPLFPPILTILSCLKEWLASKSLLSILSNLGL